LTRQSGLIRLHLWRLVGVGFLELEALFGSFARQPVDDDSRCHRRPDR